MIYLVLVLSVALAVAIFKLQATQKRVTTIDQSRQEVVGRESTLRTAIADAKQIEETLARERDALKALMDNIPDQIYFKDSQGRFVRINNSTARTLRVDSPEDALGKTDLDYFRVEEAKAFQADDKMVMDSGKPLLDRIEKATVNGKNIWMSTTKVPLFDLEGKLAGLVGISRDITDRKRAEEVLGDVVKRARCILWEAEVSRRPDGEFGWKLKLHPSDLVSQELGLDLSAGNHGAMWEKSIPKAQMQTMSRTSAAALRNGAGCYQQEFTILAKDGSPRWLKEDVQIRAGLENHWNLVGVCVDITERKQMEAELARERDLLAAANIQLSKLAREDSLTGLLNRRMILELAENEWARWKRYEKPFSLMIIDADNFKSVNDCWGHLVGDQALKLISDRLSIAVRSVDVVGRYGGEEFIIILPETNETGARKAAEKILQNIRNAALPLENTQLRMTVSIGVAEVSEGDRNVSATIERADNALLEAKHRGKDRAVLADANVLEN